MIALTVVVLLSAVLGCAGAAQNVRAYRAYAQEEPNLKVCIDRVEDLARALELVDRVLSDTSYTPNDLWARRLPLIDADARRLRDEIKSQYPYNQGDFEVPVVKLYRVWLEHVLDEYRPPPEKAMYPSLIDAVGALAPRKIALKDHWATYRAATSNLGDAAEEESKLRDEIAALKSEGDKRAKDPEFAAARLKLVKANDDVNRARTQIERDAQDIKSDAVLDTAQKQQIARDGFAALTVALRVEMEALALMPIVALETVRSLPFAPRDMTVKPNLKIVRQVWYLPMYLSGLQERANREIAAIEFLSNTLATALHTSVSDSPGMELRESVVDQIVGITLDSFRVDAHAGGEAFIFGSIGTSDRSSSSDGKVTYDYDGRKYKLDYRVQPIILASGRIDVTLDWIRMPGVASLGFGYSTDRVFKSGGSLDNTSLTQGLGIKGVASDVIDAALGLLGVRSSVRVARFTAGTVNQVIATDVATSVASAPLQLTQTQVDVGYDILFAIDDPGLKSFTEELVIGARYMRYTLPRIVYELKDTSMTAGTTSFTFNRESPPENVESIYYMIGATARFGYGEGPRWSPYLDLGIFGGAGPTSYYFLIDPTMGDVASNRDNLQDISFVGNGHAGLGLRWRLLPRGSRMRLDLRALYQGDLIYSTIHRNATQSGRQLVTDFGAFDVFHGPSIALRGAL